MREINSVQRRLEWVQPGALKMYYELRNGRNDCLYCYS